MQYVAQTPQYDASGQGGQYGFDPGMGTSQPYAQQYGQDPSAFSMYGGGDYQMQGGPASMRPKYNATAVYSGESDRE